MNDKQSSEVRSGTWWLLSVPGRLLGSVVCGLVGLVCGAVAGLCTGLAFPWLDDRH